MNEPEDRTGREPERECVENDLLLDGIPAQVWHQADPETYGAVNAAHAEFMGRPKSALENKKIRDILSPEEAEVCLKTNRELFSSGRPAISEEWVKNARGERRLLLINKSPRTDASGAVVQLVCSAVDITERALAEENLRYRDRFEKLIADISAGLINLPPSQIDAWIDSALQLVGGFERVDRAYIFLFRPDGVLMDNTHEWCAAGTEPQIKNLRDVAINAFPWWMMKLRANEEVNIPSVAALPPEAKAEREILEPQSIRSLLAVPLSIEGRVRGFIGLDSVASERTWTAENVALVRMAASIISNAVARKEIEGERLAYEALMKELATALSHRGSDYQANVRELTAMAGRLIAGDAAVYSRLEAGMLVAAGKWNLPEGYRDVDKPLGHICHDMLLGSGGETLVLPDISASHYQETDPAVKAYGYRSYAAARVRSRDGSVTGVIGVFGLAPRRLTAAQEAALPMIAQALASEEARREAYDKFAESEARWQYALEGAGDGIWDWDAQTNKVFFSWRWKDMLGYSGGEIGDSLDEWSSRVHPDDLQGAMEQINRHFEGKTEHYMSEHRLKCKDGSYKWILDRGKIISRTPDGKPLRVIGTHTDIDARKRLEVENKESLAKLGSLMENMHAGLLLESPERRVMYANRQLCELFGIPVPPPALQGTDCARAAVQSAELMKDPETFLAGIEAAMKAGKPVLGRTLELKDGRFFEQNYIPVYLDDGSFVGHMWKYNDVTAVRKLEEMRLEVTHHVNHELRRPITSQVLALDFLRDELQGKLTAEQESILASAAAAARNMTRMAEDLLDVTKSETGKLSIIPETFSLEEAASAFVTAAGVTAKEHGLSLGLEAEKGLPPVHADPARVRQVLGNLVDNALKFTASGGITISLAHSAAHPGMAEVSVSDTGQGMEKADLERIFDRLYQTLNISRRGMKGLGLGLYICKTLVENQGGRIWVESEKGKGSVFRFTLPFAKPAA